MNDIGIVEYTKDLDQKCIHAYWFYQKDGRTSTGTGKTVGELGDTYEGDYIVTYYNQNGIELTSYNLKIIKNQEFYELQWLDNGDIKFTGIGMEKNNKLYAGWKIHQEVCT